MVVLSCKKRGTDNILKVVIILCLISVSVYLGKYIYILYTHISKGIPFLSIKQDNAITLTTFI